MQQFQLPVHSLQDDQEVMEDLRELFSSRRKVPQVEQVQEVAMVNRKAIVDFLEKPVGFEAETSPETGFFTEAIVLAVGRPSLLIQGGKIDLDSVQVGALKTRLTNHRATIEKPIPSVGRVELISHPDLEWVGTGWMIDENIIATNRHVAQVFAIEQNGRFAFRRFLGRIVASFIDFHEEHHRPEELEIEVEEILFVSPDGDQHPDIAFLKVRRHDSLPAPLELADADPRLRDDIGIVGYPAWDGRRNPGPAMAQIFHDIFDVKRYAPGQISDVAGHVISHDCSTLGGNSGSPVLSQESGKVVGLHFAGRFMSNNFAVPVSVIKRELGRLSSPRIAVAAPEALESFEDRKGYDEEFLGRGRRRVPLPALSPELLEDAAPVQGRERQRGIGKFVLDYTHFSVVMNKTRRLAFFTAVNIDGTQDVTLRRRQTPWRTDPRIDLEHQLDNEVYARNKLDRGHLVRRLDPVWGPPEVARQADKDTFHYTNAAPQHEQLNQKEWLALEEYLLDNTNEDDQKLTVFTGPVFTPDDPAFRTTTLPVDFWKVAVMAKAGGGLLATAYLLSQKQFMDDLEFVIGAFRTYQTPIRMIEERTGLDFGTLRDHDPLDSRETFALPIIEGPADIILG